MTTPEIPDSHKGLLNAQIGVLGTIGHGPGQFGWIHELACPSENLLYAAELLNWRVQRLTLEPTQ